MYGEIYYHEYCIEGTEQEARLSILERDYVQASTEVGAGPVPFRKTLLNEDGDLVGGVYPTKASIQLLGDENFGMDDLFSADATQFQVIHFIEGEVDWVGYIAPEGFGEDDTDGIRYLNLNAYDGLTLLKERKFLNAEGLNYFTDTIFTTESVLFNIKEALKKTGLELDILTLCDRIPVPVNPSDDLSMLVDIIPEQTTVYNSRFSEFGPLLQAGNYFRYRAEYETSYRLTRITEVLTGDGVMGIRVDPPFPIQMSLLWGQIIEPTGNLDRDPLEHARLNVRMWIDPAKTPRSENKEDADKKYYEYTEGTATCWHVLDTIAKTFDMRVVQRKGAWYVEALDSYRIEGVYHRYDYDGVFIDNPARYTLTEIPDCGSETHNKITGGTRSFDKILNNVTVSYNYRYKTEGDSLTNLLINGGLVLPPGSTNPATNTPGGWNRVQLRDRNGNLHPINFSINKLLLNPTEIYTTDTFNQYNRLTSTPIKVSKGDKVSFSWMQSINENNDTSGGNIRAVFLFELKCDNGDIYHLVNYREQPGWENSGNGYSNTSGKPEGQWIKVDRTFFHFNSNYSTQRYVGSGWGWSEMSLVELSSPEIPESGEITVSFVGSASLFQGGGFSVEDGGVRSYVIDYARWVEEGTLNYIEQTPGPENFIGVRWASRGIRLSGMGVWVVPTTDRGDGRVYEYQNDRQYFETLDIPTALGDEINDNHISAVIVNSRQTDTWINRDGSLYMGSLGVLLARSVMRRYFRPKYLLDGELTAPIEGLADPFVLEAPAGGTWLAKGADYDSKFLSLSGTFSVLPLETLPYSGATDHGENSLTGRGEGSGSSTSSSGAGSGGSPAVQPTPDLQSVTEAGSGTSLTINTKGTRNRSLLAVPKTPVVSGDVITGETYLHADNGYVYIDGVKAKAGTADTATEAGHATTAGTATEADDSERWGGKLYGETFDQDLKTTDTVEFAYASLGGLNLAVGEAPATATDTGTAGEVRITAGFIYVCVATDTWVRAPLNTW